MQSSESPRTAGQFGANDYIVLGELCSQLAIACFYSDAVSSLMKLALNYLRQGHSQFAAEPHPRPDPLGFGD
jgi:hypothetical protein